MSLNSWIMAIRPKTLPASISPIILANALCWGAGFSWTVAILTLLTAISLQIAVNFANDYFDFKSGVDSDKRLGPKRATQSGLISPKAMFGATILALTFALASSSYLIYLGGVPILVLFILSAIAVLWYSGGPLPLASLGMGELTVFLFFGWVAVAGTQYLHLGKVTSEALMLGTQMGFISAAIMLVNNLRDIPTDTPAGKKTLAVRLGKAHSETLYNILLVTPFLIQLWMFFSNPVSAGYVLPFLATPLMVRLIRQLPEQKNEQYNVQLASTASFLFAFSLTASAGQLLIG